MIKHLNNNMLNGNKILNNENVNATQSTDMTDFKQRIPIANNPGNETEKDSEITQNTRLVSQGGNSE